MRNRYLMLLTTLAFLGLCVSVPAFAGKDKNCDSPNPHPSCGGGDSGSGVDALYMVTSTEDFVSGEDWHDGASKGSIKKGEVLSKINLGYFVGVNSPFKGFGPNCFPVDEFHEVDLFTGKFEKYQGSLAKGMFWFAGKTYDGNVDDTVGYLLKVFGTFDPFGNWPPEKNDSNTLTMTGWEMKTANEGNEIKNISCIGAGDTDSGFPTTDIIVTRTE